MYRWIPIVLLLPSLAVAAELTARLDRPTVVEDETVRLIIEMDGMAHDLAPDVSALSEDFEILDRTQSTQMEIVNGRTQSKTQWIFELAPLRAGDLEIPALSVGPHTAPAVTLEVLPRDDTVADGESRPLFIETEVNTTEPYVQSQVQLVIRLFQSVNANILDGTLTEPKPEDAVVQRLGDDIRYQTTRKGETYVVIERRYALFPTASGQFEIPPILFDGHVADAAYRRALRDRFFSRGRRTRLRSDPIRLQVRPRPDEFSGAHWLPARDLSLNDAWSEADPDFRVGEPVTRTIRLKATGLDVTQLPEVEIGAIDGAKLYPDKPVTRRSADSEWVYGTREQKLAVVPTRAGTFRLPAIRLAWWDTRADQQRVAEIPAREIVVAAAPGAPDTPPPVPEPAPAVPDAARDPAPPVVARGSEAPGVPDPGYWPYVSGGLLVAWLTTLLAWWRQRRARAGTTPDVDAAPDVRESMRQLRRACKRGEAAAARAALLRWAAGVFPDNPPLNLGQLARRLEDASLTGALLTLDQALYGRGEWDGEALWRSARGGLKPPTAARQRRSPLPELYPQRT